MEVFVAVEGIDGAGKSCLVKALAGYYRKKGRQVWHTREPWEESGSGRQLRTFLHKENKAKENKTDKMEGEEEISLRLAEKFVANRKEHSQEIRKRLDKKEVVLCERYDFSTYAYQTMQLENKRLDKVFLQLYRMHDYGFAAGCIEPKATLFLRIPVETALERIAQRFALDGKQLERYENKDNLTIAVKRYDATLDFLHAMEKKKPISDTATSRLFLKLDAVQDRKKIFDQAISFLLENNL